jgi:hypothetical protein
MTHRLLAAWLSIALLFSGSVARAQLEATPAPLLPVETQQFAKATPLLLMDRDRYHADDEVGLGYVLLAPATTTLDGTQHATVTLLQGDKTVAEARVEALLTPKLHLRLDPRRLKPGEYTLRATLLDGAGQAVGAALTRTLVVDDHRDAKPAPLDVPLTLTPAQRGILGPWAVRAGVPLPRLAAFDPADLCITEDGVPIPAELTVAATWGPGGAGEARSSIEWLHAHWVARQIAGRVPEYRLTRRRDAKPRSDFSISAQARDGAITVDTGVVQFVVSARKFAGIEKLWHDASGKRQYDDAHLLIDGPGGPFAIDDKLLRYAPGFDEKTSVEIETQSPVRVVLLVRGWYVNDQGRTDPLLRYKARITASAGSPVVRITQHDTITFNTFDRRISDLGFDVAIRGGSDVTLGLDQNAWSSPIPAKGTAFVHQERHDRARLVGFANEPMVGGVLDGWFTVNTAKSPVAVLVRDMREKFPNEVTFTRDSVGVHFWPRHGRRAYSVEEETSLEQIYKFRCFHQGRLLDLHLPSDYVEKWEEYMPGARESRSETAATSNGQGLMISNEIAIAPMPPEDAPAVTGTLHRQFIADPIARPAPEWNCASAAFGPMSPRDTGGVYGPVEEALETSLLVWGRRMHSNQNYGKFIWGNTHSGWDVHRNAPRLHRIWLNSHYRNVGLAWWMLYRSDNSEWLSQARAFTDNFINTGTVHYAETTENPNRPGRQRAAIKYHVLGAMYHCKAVLPWGVEDYGVGPQDSHAGVVGHWIDPDAYLWSWYIDASALARDTYEQWSEAIAREGLPRAGTKREFNTTLAYAITLYQQTWNPDLLPGIRGMAGTLREVPLDRQTPGPLWHPLWINRYVDQTRDPAYTQFIIDNALGRDRIFDTWITGLGALGFELTGDRGFLEPQRSRMGRFAWQMFRMPGDDYDWFGGGPGPLGNMWGEMGFGRMLTHLKAQKITPTTTGDECFYPLNGTWFQFARKGPPTLVLGLSQSNSPVQLSKQMAGTYGNLSPVSLRVLDPAGRELFRSADPVAQDDRMPGGGGSRLKMDQVIAASGEPGVYQFELRGGADVEAGFTGLPHEAALLPAKVDHFCNRLGIFISPIDAAPASVTVTARNYYLPYNNIPNYFRLTDSRGAVIMDTHLFSVRQRKMEQKQVDVSQHPLPWRVDGSGPGIFSLDFAGRPWLMGRSMADLDAIRPHAAKLLTP